MCGGTLLDTFTVLTAAHCILSLNAVNYNVYVGAHEINSMFSYPTVFMTVKNVIKHPIYDSSNGLNDIAILQLSQPVAFNQYAQPACLPNPSYGSYPSSTNITSVYAAWWGTLSYEGSLPQVLYNVQLNNYPSEYCKAYGEFSFPENETKICAGEFSGGKDTCQGDSGGGLYSYETMIYQNLLLLESLVVVISVLKLVFQGIPVKLNKDV